LKSVDFFLLQCNKTTMLHNRQTARQMYNVTANHTESGSINGWRWRQTDELMNWLS